MTRTRKSKKKQPIMENFVQKVAAKNTGAKFVINPEGEISMSDAISQLIEPFREDAADYQSFHTLVTFACIAWNAAILPFEDQKELLQKTLAEFPPQKNTRIDVLRLIQALRDRKELLFPNVSRMIVEFNVTELGDDFHIAIASTLGKQAG